MMGGQSSKRRGGDSPPLPIQVNTADLSSYEDACQRDPDLQSFDTMLHQRTNRVYETLASGVEVRSLSFGSLKEVTNCLLEMNQEVVRVILESQEDVWNNKDLFALVEEYFENSVRTLEYCAALENSLKQARHSQLIIKVVLKQFEEEERLPDGIAQGRYVKTLEELQKFTAAGAPFKEEFFELFNLVYKQQISMLQKLQLRKRKLDKKMKSMKTWRRVSNVLFVATFVSVLIFSVVAAAIAAPPVVTALAGALAVPIGSVGKWCNYLWNRYETELKAQKELLNSMYFGTYITIKDMDNIRVQVNKLEIQIESLLQKADFALAEEEAVKLVIDEIKKQLDVFMETIEDLGERAGKCSRDIRQARTVILQRIIKYPDH